VKILEGVNSVKSNSKNSLHQNSFIIEFWNKIFLILSKISIFYLIKLFKNNVSYRFVDGWVLFNLIFSIISSLLTYYLDLPFFLYFFSLYAALRIFEIIIYQLNVLIFDPYRAKKKNIKYKIKSAHRMILLLLHNYVEIMFWYSTITVSLLKLTNHFIQLTWYSYVQANILCIASLDQSSLLKITTQNINFLSHLAFFAVITGLIITIISITRFINVLPNVEQIEEY